MQHRLKHVVIPLSGEKMTSIIAHQTVTLLGGAAWGFKFHPTKVIRYYREGYDAIQHCKSVGAKVFIDLKGFDIPSEVADMIRDLSALGVDIITVHASGGWEMLRNAVLAAGNKTKIYAITILTSMKEDTASDIYGGAKRDERIIHFARLAAQTGCHGTVSSGADLALFQENELVNYGIHGRMKRIVPGIRWKGVDITGDDQDRVMEPAEAYRAGADLEVIGRPITGAENALLMLERANAEIWAAYHR